MAWCAVTGLAVLLAWSFAPSASVAAPEKQAAGPVEYKVVPASEFGMRVSSGEGIFNYSDMAEGLNQYAAEGWQYRDFIKAADGSTALSAVLLERRR